MAKITDKVLNVRLGALYRFAAKTGMPRADVEAILASHASMSGKDAAQLAAHWFASEPLREQRREMFAALDQEELEHRRAVSVLPVSF